MSEKSNLVKKETLIYTLFFGLVTGFVCGVVVAVYKLSPPTNTPDVHAPHAQAETDAQLKRQTTTAIANLKEALVTDPENLNAWIQLGNLYYDTDQAAKAIAAYSKSLELQPDNANVWTDIGVMYRKNKQYNKALESFEKAYAIEPNHIPSRLNKGIVLLYDFHKHEEAIAVWEELLRINPGIKMNNGMPLTEAIEEVKREIKAPAHSSN